jgi:hypothetical protein
VLLKLLVYLYGDIEAGFRYEARRNTGFGTTGAKHRHGTSVFLFTDVTVTLASGRPARCTLVAFVDDHFILGHPVAAAKLAKLLEALNEYKEPFQALTLGAAHAALGIELTLHISPTLCCLELKQTAYGRLWTGRFIQCIHPRRLSHSPTPGYAAGRMKTPGGGGILGDVARSFISAAYWAARHSLIEMLEPLNFLSCQVGPDWSLAADSGLIHVYGFWLRVLDNRCECLELRIHLDDVKARSLCLNEYSDADHASELRRKSTGGAIGIVESSSGKSRALLDAGCKTQPSVSRSSGESESTALHELIVDLAGENRPTKLQRELVDRSADRAKALANAVARVACPLNDLAAWLGDERFLLSTGRVYVDATVCQAVAASGESKALAHIAKSQAVDLLWLRDVSRHLGLLILKVDSERNVADLLTKAVSRKVLEQLLPILGRR